MKVLTAEGVALDVPTPLVILHRDQAYEVRTTDRGRLVMFRVVNTKNLTADRPTGEDGPHNL